MPLKIIQWNIRGYLNNYLSLQLLIQNYKPQIIALQETHLSTSSPIPIPINFKLYHNSTQVALLIHKAIQHELLSSHYDIDAIAVKIYSKKTFTIFSAYISPSTKFTTANLLKSFNPTQNSSSLILGDFNSWNRMWGSPKDNNRGKIIAQYINSYYTLLNNGSYTHFSTHNTFTHIDLSFCSPLLSLDSSWNTDQSLHNSDHFPIIIKLFNTPNTSPFSPPTPKFLTQLADWDYFKSTSHHLQHKIPVSNNINKEGANINKIILTSAHLSIPQTKPGKITNKTVPWWNRELESLKKNKNEAWSKLKHSISIANIINYKKTTAKFKYNLKLAKKKAIFEFTSTINPRTPSKIIWSNIRRFCGIKTSSYIHCINQQNSNITNSIQIAESFCEFWSNQADDNNFHSTFQSNKQALSTTLPTNHPLPEALSIETPFTYIEMQSALCSLKGKTPGHDRINYDMLKHLSDSNLHRLLNLFNNIFNNYLPQNYKISTIIPIPKPNSEKTLLNSYRPISLLPCTSKLLDKLVANRLWWFCSKYNLINTNQLGFKKGKSVTDNLIYVDHLITKSLSSHNHISILSLDFSKAFDRVGLHSIIHQLNKWQVGPKMKNYIFNFMTNRQIKVRANNQYSSTKQLNNGIPQGSPISVLLFLIGYNQLCKTLSIQKEIHFSAYADDFIILIPLNGNKNTNVNLNPLFTEIRKWTNYSGAVLSLAKCKHLHICRKRNCSCSISTDQILIPNVNQLKILGITINNKYRWNNHIQSLKNELSPKLNIIKCLSSNKFNCNSLTLINITKAIIQSKIDYGLYLYGYAPKNLLKPISSTLNAGIRLALGAFRTTPIPNMLFESNTMTLETRRDFLTAKICKTLINSLDSPIHNLITESKSQSQSKKPISTLQRIISQCSSLDLPYKSNLSTTPAHPPWTFPTSTTNLSLSSHKKATTPPTVYCKLFFEITENLKNYNLVFTDGSKSEISTSYSVTTSSSIIEMAVLPSYSTIYSAEIIAINQALNHLKNIPGKYAICTDSLSSIEAISNINNNNLYPILIRNILTRLYPKFILVWIPGHVGIPGNDFADQAAKLAPISPLISTSNFNFNDLSIFLKKHFSSSQYNSFSFSSPWYQATNSSKNNINELHNRVNDDNKFTRTDLIKYTRLRLGHTNLTHSHYFTQEPPPLCQFCHNSTMNIEHLLLLCNKFQNLRIQIFKTKNPLSCLSLPSTQNIYDIITFLKLSNSYQFI